jgi:hypothetical protein
MVSSLRRFGAAALLGLAVGLALPALALAQIRPGVGPGGVAVPFGVNRGPFNGPFSNLGPFYMFGNTRAQMALNQSAFNVAMLGRAYSNVPPYLFGYNPYPSPIYATGGVYNGAAAYNPYLYGGYGGGYGSSIYGSPYGAGTATLATNPYGVGPYGAGSATLDPYSAAASAYAPSSSSYYPDPYGGYLRGVADVISSTGNYYLTMQNARLMNEQVKRSQLDTRRKILDEARYERMQQPTAEDLRQQDLEAAYNRARHDPPATEVWSGRSLNDLLRNLVSLQKRGLKGPNVPLDEDTLKHVNLKVAGGTGNVGLLKGDGSLDWPASLQDARFAEDRKRFADQLANAVEQVKLGNRVEPARLKDMRAELDRLSDTLDKSVTELSPTKYIEGMRYLNQLGDALRALDDRKVSDLVSSAWVGKVKNVAELVKYLGDSGLEFAPAVGSGDEAAYRALHGAMAAFDYGIASVAKAPTSPPPAPEK